MNNITLLRLWSPPKAGLVIWLAQVERSHGLLVTHDTADIENETEDYIERQITAGEFILLPQHT